MIACVCAQKGDARLTWSSASALMRAADGCETVRHMVREHGGLELVVRLLRDGLAAAAEGSQSWAAALLGAFWKSAVAVENVDAYQELGANSLLIRVSLRALYIAVIQLVTGFPLAKQPSMPGYRLGMEIIEDHDGVRLLWSLLRNRHRKVQIQALWAIKPTVTRAKNSGEVIRELTGALELLVALDYENLSVMTEQGVVRHLSHIAQQRGDDAMRRELCSAIANCCYVRDNLGQFGRTHIIQVASGFLSTKCPTLLAQACRCFYILSRDPINCIVMHGCGIVPCLLAAIESCCPVRRACGGTRSLKRLAWTTCIGYLVPSKAMLPLACMEFLLATVLVLHIPVKYLVWTTCTAYEYLVPAKAILPLTYMEFLLAIVLVLHTPVKYLA
ncbi:Armadillo repeat-containing protein gudu [Gryllus bimaculatus]|nr:Armadillo repeat-containing protein gudu [Gryllus bimaculatus]